VTLKWQSSYGPFNEKSIPEIKDLNVIPSFQRQGIGSQLLDVAEEVAKEHGNVVGIGVGLSKDYGQAQKLYINRGYIPDGEGLTYDYKPIHQGNTVAVDDELCLWLTKKLD
jgi:GNAT superfamily N-acetyltransferase